MLTLERLKEMPEGIFASGVGMDGQREIRWIATRGGFFDWAVYYGHLDWSEDQIKRGGDKLFTETNIRHFVHCDDEAYAMYRF